MRPEDEAVVRLLEGAVLEVERDRSLHAPWDQRLALLAITRELDCIAANKCFAGSPTFEEGWNTLNAGSCRALFSYLGTGSIEAGIPNYPMTDELRAWAWHDIEQAGAVERTNHLIDLVREGMCRVSVDGKDVRTEVDVGLGGIEPMEARDLPHTLPSVGDVPPFTDRRPQYIERALARNVKPWMDAYIQYLSTEELDEFFFNQAVRHCKKLGEFDWLPDDATLGGVKYRTYLNGLVFLMARRFLHLGFCQALHRKTGGRSALVNTLTNWQTSAQLQAPLLENGFTEHEATAIVDVMTADVATGVPRHLIGPDAPSPLFVPIGGMFRLASLRGAIGNPISYLNRSLQARHRGDYDRAVDGREAVFRDRVNALFHCAEEGRIFRATSSFPIRIDGHVITDIDAIVFDAHACQLGLFQLKWQDTFGAVGPERRSKLANFERTGWDWVQRVRKFIGEVGASPILHRIGVRSAPRQISTYLFVLGRNFSARSGGAPPNDSDVAWGNWNQIARLVDGNRISRRSAIASLHEVLRADSPHLRLHEFELIEDRYRLGDLEITVPMIALPRDARV